MNMTSEAPKVVDKMSDTDIAYEINVINAELEKTFPRRSKEETKDLRRRWRELLNERDCRQEVAERARMERVYGTSCLSQKSRDNLWSLSWAHGHSSGFSEVENYYIELADLALCIKNDG